MRLLRQWLFLLCPTVIRIVSRETSSQLHLMLDPALQQLTTQPSASTSSASTRTRSPSDPILRADVERFNPFLSLVSSDLPDSFYPVLSIYSAFSLVSCNRTRHDEGLACVSLDHTSGFIMATQGRYPDSVFFTLYRDDWDVDRSGVNLEAVMQQASSLNELKIYTLTSNSLGVDVCFCSMPTTEKLEIVVSDTRWWLATHLGRQARDTRMARTPRLLVLESGSVQACHHIAHLV